MNIEHEVEKLLDFIKINFLFNMKTGDPFIDTIISTFFAFGISILISHSYKIYDFFAKSISTVGSMVKLYSSITIEGKRTFRTSSWCVRTNNIWGKRFDAIWDHINSESKYEGINSLKEMLNNVNIVDSNSINNDFDNDIYVVDENCCSFPLNKERTIYATVKFSDNSSDSDKVIEMCGQVETIQIKIYSRTLDINMLKEYVDNITRKYLEKIKKQRDGKIFIYSLHPKNKSEEENDSNIWMERPFRSTRKFNNLYFDGKDDLIKKVDFFTNNKDWYENEGHPYTLGIGLSGSPGTGKTSVIKCLANKLNRHLIQIPLNKVKSEADFYNYFFESTYNNKNERNSIDFEDKIIVLEDIDCMSDVILDRSKTTNTITDNSDNTDLDMIENIVNAVSIANSDDKKSTFKTPFKKDDDKLTLSFILNLIDGLDETYGRILIITSNHYDRIDPALVRPGRIDLKIEMKKASVNTIKDMYHHYYQTNIPNKIKSKLIDHMISPAELVNYYRITNSSKEFLDNIIRACNENA